MPCTNAILQGLDPQSRCIFVLGTMFKADSRKAGEVLGIIPEAYGQRRSRIRKKMASFLDDYCGEYDCGQCKCKDKINYVILNHRLSPTHLEGSQAF